MPKVPKDKKEEMEIKLSRLNMLIEECRLDLAIPFSLGVVRSLEKMHMNNDISDEDYEEMNKDLNQSIVKSNKCFCEHPKSIFA